MKCIIRMYLGVYISRSRNATNSCTELNPKQSLGVVRFNETACFRISMSENSRISHKSLCVFDDNTLTRFQNNSFLTATL